MCLQADNPKFYTMDLYTNWILGHHHLMWSPLWYHSVICFLRNFSNHFYNCVTPDVNWQACQNSPQNYQQFCAVTLGVQWLKFRVLTGDGDIWSEKETIEQTETSYDIILSFALSMHLPFFADFCNRGRESRFSNTMWRRRVFRTIHVD